jgi:transcriptional regulator with PAS, ATPase and Fis domain
MGSDAQADPAELAKTLARGETPAAWPENVPAPARALLAEFARSCGERLLELEGKEARAQRSIVDLRMIVEGYSRVKRELRRENEQLKTAYDVGRQPMIGADAGLASALRIVNRVLDTPIPILITGATGTGKEVLARHMHARGSRSDGPFIAINCAALPEALLESELFGIEKGVATGVEKRTGKLEEANGGMLFLDEIGDMPLPMQAKLLRALQEQEVVRLGGSRPIRIDARIVSATNRDLKAAIAAQTFREDLYYRLVGVHVHLPPLRERPGDVDRLVDHFIAETARRFGRSVRAIAPEAREALRRYPWPGNVRELIAEIQRAVAIAETDTVTLEDLTPSVVSGGGVRAPGPAPAQAAAASPAAAGSGADGEAIETLREARRRFERGYVQRVLERVGGSKRDAAKVLGLTPEGLRRRLQSLEMGKDAGDSADPDDDD